MAVERVGTVYITAALNSTSLSVTVPNDAELAIICGKYYNAETSVPLIGSTSSISVVNQTDIDYRPLMAMYYMVSPPTGSQTVYFGASQGFTQAYTVAVAFYKGVNTSSPILSSASTVDGTDITGLTAGVGSMMVGLAGGYYNIPTVTDNGQTQLALEEAHGFGVAQIAEATAFYFTGTSIRAVALTIAPAITGAALPRRAIDGPFYGSLRGSVR